MKLALVFMMQFFPWFFYFPLFYLVTFVFTMAHSPPVISSKQVSCWAFKPSPLRPDLLLQQTAWLMGWDFPPWLPPWVSRLSKIYVPLFLDDTFLFLQHIFLSLPKKWCMRGQFSGPCLSQKIFILYSHLDASLAEDNTVGWKSFSSKLLKALHSCLFFLFALNCVAYGTLVPQPGTKPRPSTVEAWSHTTGLPGNPPYSYLLTFSAADEKSILFSLLFSLLYQWPFFFNCKFF